MHSTYSMSCYANLTILKSVILSFKVFFFASDVLTSEAESEDSTVSIRRSGRTKKGKSAWSPSQDKTRLLPLTPLPEEEEQEEKSSKRRKRIDDVKIF